MFYYNISHLFTYIILNRGSLIRDFIINFKAPTEEVFNCIDQKILEIYIRPTGDFNKIKYGGSA